MSLINNIFHSNIAKTSGSSIFIQNSNNQTFINLILNRFINNSIHDLSSFMIGSVIHLINPINISIDNNSFISNRGRSGCCLYYEEKYSIFSFLLTNNTFFENIAFFGGGCLYISNYFNKIVLTKNIYKSNQADYGQDYTTKPFRVALYSNSHKKKFIEKNKLYSIAVVPGISEIDLHFHILDYYDQKIAHLNGTTYLKLKKLADFTDIDLKTNQITLEGLMAASIFKGSFYSFINNLFKGIFLFQN